MIRFFRHIRKLLMEQKKIRSYVLYAFGEIILVMIGILLALQVNNWNETRKENLKEEEILSYAIENFKADSLSLNKIISIANSILKVQNDLIKLSKGQLQESDIANLNAIRKSEPNQIISKKINLDLPNQVRSVKLKKAILDYFLDADALEFTILNYNQLMEQSVRPFLGQKKLMIYGAEIGDNGLSNSNLINLDRFFSEFKNEEIQQILFETTIKIYIFKNTAERLSNKNSELLHMIYEYLDKQ
ncbi:MAG TPA: DUF6090 family protein [Roseivirga sp.]